MPLSPDPATTGVSHQELKLSCHPATPCGTHLEVCARVQIQASQPKRSLVLQFELLGEIDRILLPPMVLAQPADGLWQHTCAELFVRTAGSPAYQEFNFSPSGQWAAYRFSSERQRDTQAEAEHPALPPTIQIHTATHHIGISVHLPLHNLPSDANGGLLRMGLSLVTERDDGDLTYWALHHPRADRPDFHHQDGCALTLPLPPSVENLL